MIKLLFLFFPVLLLADVALQQLQQSPSGHVRNFHIWQFMQEDNISAEDADQAYSLVDGYNHKIFNLYAQKTDNKDIIEEYRCSKLKIKDIFEEKDAACLDKAISLTSVMQLEDSQREKLAMSLKENNPKKSKQLLLMNEKPFLLGLLKSEDDYLEFFNTLGYKYRHQYFNVRLSKERINSLADQKAFEKAVKYIVTDHKMHRMQTTLLGLSQHELSAQTYFFLALNALKAKQTKKASYYLELSQNKAYYQMDKDKAQFWIYLISKKREDLEILSHSSDINIYTLYANEILDIEVNNYFSTLQLDPLGTEHDLGDPYVWEELLAKIRSSDTQALQDLLVEYSSKNDEVFNAFIYTKSLKYKMHNYIMPYAQATEALSNENKALLYALARQESHFIPTAISRSFALGVMQMMPFLIHHIAKQKDEQIELNEMFDPYKNISYAVKHIQYLQKHLYHPLFIAYAYNGGIGFTKRHLLGNTFLPGSFEPFMSMELMANAESREYGKKVLANYVIYKKILGEEVKITSLFQTLTEPSRTDRFRMKALVLKH